MSKTLLFNPINITHDRNIAIFRKLLPDWNMRCIYNPKFPWFSEKKRTASRDTFCFTNNHFQAVPKGVFDDVKAVMLFTAQLRVPPCSLVQEAALRSIPVIAIEEVYQIMLEQGFVNNYLLPVDHFFAASDYEREHFIKAGMPEDVVETIGYLLHVQSAEKQSAHEVDVLRRSLRLDRDKSTATLCLGYMKIGGETWDTRRELITRVAQGLPPKYEFLIKIHPSAEETKFNDFVKVYAPQAKILDPRMPINKVLDITDVLINQGNSQVVVDALNRRVPVVCIPLDIKTFFHGCLDEVIVKGDKDLGRVLEIVERKGIDLYDVIFKKYFPITYEKAIGQFISRISQITERRELYKPETRLAELALYWAWMEQIPQALETLLVVRGDFRDRDYLERIYKLILCRATTEDIRFLRDRHSGTYKEMILQSLWIKSLYVTGRKLDTFDREWFAQYPPWMNRTQCLPYAVLLYWCYLRSGNKSECDILLKKLYSKYSNVHAIKRLKFYDAVKERQYRSNIYYWAERARYNVNLITKNLMWRAETFRR